MRARLRLQPPLQRPDPRAVDDEGRQEAEQEGDEDAAAAASRRPRARPTASSVDRVASWRRRTATSTTRERPPRTGSSGTAWPLPSSKSASRPVRQRCRAARRRKTGLSLTRFSRSRGRAPRTGRRSASAAAAPRRGWRGRRRASAPRSRRAASASPSGSGRDDDVDQPVGAVQAAPEIVVLAIGAAEEGAEAVELDALQRRLRRRPCGSRPRRWARSGRP